MISFGLVHIPRYLWRVSSVSLRYKYLTFELVNLNKDMHAAHKELDRVLKVSPANGSLSTDCTNGDWCS